MPTTYTSLLGLALPATGELSGTWGTTVNDAITSLVDSSVAGTTTLSSDADVTLTTTSGVANQARQAIILWTANGSTTRNITAPATSKTYVVINASAGTQSIVIRGAGPTTGVTIIKGERAVVAWNGSDFVKVATPPAGSDTQVQYNSSGSLAGSANLTFNGTTLTANALTVSTGNLAFSGTAQRITGDMSNATLANRLAFQTSAANSATGLFVLPSGTSQISQVQCFNNSDPTNAARLQLAIGNTEAQVLSSITGTGTYLPMTFYTGGSERMRVDTSGNVGIGTASPVAGYVLNVVNDSGNAQQLIRAGTNFNSTISFGDQASSTSGQLLYAHNGDYMRFDTNGSERMRIDSSGNVGIGTTSPAQLVEASLSQNGKTQIKVTNVNAGVNTSAGVLFGTSSGDNGYIGANGGAASSALGGANAVQVTNLTANPVVLATNGVARLTLSSTGAITSSDLADAVGYKGTPLNEQSANYTLVIGDMGKSITHPASDNNPRTFTIPANGAVAYPVGTAITFVNMINTVTIAITTDTMYLAGAGTTGSRTLAAYGMATAVKMTSTTWIISGNGLT